MCSDYKPESQKASYKKRKYFRSESFIKRIFIIRQRQFERILNALQIDILTRVVKGCLLIVLCTVKCLKVMNDDEYANDYFD